ncbi:MAG: hypothetical protein KKB21_05605 [Nanoarchaeota archaeon]|nr:hypothetical protein [Nanoarchaeota archaeon]MBU4087023.1 hypothetical protein [Nanoarchaeota archaeon]
MEFLSKEVLGMTAQELIINSVIAIVLVVIGIVIGKIISGVLRKIIDKARIEKTPAHNFFNMLTVIIKWGVYVLFLNLAISQLDIPQFTYWISEILIIIPALVGALLLIIVGFAIAIYLKKAIEDSKVESARMLSQIFFFFIIYVSMIFALKTALISMDSVTVNILVIVLTGIIGMAIAYRTVKREKSRK